MVVEPLSWQPVNILNLALTSSCCIIIIFSENCQTLIIDYKTFNFIMMEGAKSNHGNSKFDEVSMIHK